MRPSIQGQRTEEFYEKCGQDYFVSYMKLKHCKKLFRNITYILTKHTIFFNEFTKNLFFLKG